MRCLPELAGRRLSQPPEAGTVKPRRHGQQTELRSANLMRKVAHRRLERRISAMPQTVSNDRVDEPPKHSVQRNAPRKLADHRSLRIVSLEQQ